MKTKILTLQYQRNGIAGEPFYTALVENVSGVKGKFLITFTSDNSDKEVENCRCVMIEGDENCFYKKWRGDNIGYELNVILKDLIKEQSFKNFYDLCESYKAKISLTPGFF